MSSRQLLGLLALCLWSSLGWLAAEWLPGRMAPLAGEGFHLLLIGLGGVTLGGGIRRYWKVAGAGLLLVGAPFLLLHEAQGTASGGLGVVAFALVPAGVMVVEGDLGLLPWALAGAAGVMVLVPFALPVTAREWAGAAMLGVAGALTAFGLVRMRRSLQEHGLVGAVGALCLASGGVLMLAASLEGPMGWGWGAVAEEVLRALLLDLPQVVLLVWLLREGTALQVSVRYLAAPLLTVLEGWALVRPGIDARMLTGLAMLAGGAYGLLRRSRKTSELGLNLR